MRPSFIGVLRVPALFAVAWLLTRGDGLFVSSFAATAVLLCGGALVAGFIASAQRHHASPQTALRPVAASAVALVFRFGIGLPLIAGMLYAALRVFAA